MCRTSSRARPRSPRGSRGATSDWPSRGRAKGGSTTSRAKAIPAELLGRHYRQLRTGHGTVLLGDPPPRNDTAPKLERAWFVDGCPLEPNDAVEAIRKRHGFGSRTDALRALRNARTELREAKHPDAKVMGDLP